MFVVAAVGAFTPPKMMITTPKLTTPPINIADAVFGARALASVGRVAIRDPALLTQTLAQAQTAESSSGTLLPPAVLNVRHQQPSK